MGNAVKYTRTIFEPEHELFRESYRAFLDKHVKPFHDQWEKDKIVDRGVWLEAGKARIPRDGRTGAVRRWGSDFRYNTVVVEETVAGRSSGLGFSCTTTSLRPTCCKDQRGAETALAAAVLHRRDDHRDRHDRTGDR